MNGLSISVFIACGILAGVVAFATSPVLAGGYTAPASRAVAPFVSLVTPPVTVGSFLIGGGGSSLSAGGGSSPLSGGSGGSVDASPVAAPEPETQSGSEIKPTRAIQPTPRRNSY